MTAFSSVAYVSNVTMRPQDSSPVYKTNKKSFRLEVGDFLSNVPPCGKVGKRRRRPTKPNQPFISPNSHCWANTLQHRHGFDSNLHVMSFQCRVWALSAEVNVTSCKFTTYTGSQIIAEFLSRLLCYCFPGDIPDWFTSFVRAQPSLKNCRFCLIQYFPEVRALKIVFTLSSKMLKSLAMYTGYLLFKTRKPSCMFDRMITGDDISAHVKRCKPSKKLFEFSRKWTPKLNPSLH